MARGETRNIIDHYHYWKNEAILADLDSKRKPFAVLCSNLAIDFNIGTVIRNANAFLAEKVYVYGHRQWDRRGAVGTQNYTHFKYVMTIDELDGIEGYTWVGMDNIPGATPVEEFEWPEHPLICLGQEQLGLPDEILDRCEQRVYISQYGSVRSLNVGVASGIAMYDFCSKL